MIVNWMQKKTENAPLAGALKSAILDGPSEGQIPSIEVQTHTLCFK